VKGEVMIGQWTDTPVPVMPAELAGQLGTDEAMRAATLGDALAVRRRQWAAAAPRLRELPASVARGCHETWTDGNAAVIAYWGQVPRPGLTDNPAAMALPNPAAGVRS
jgi:hypothetical protein